MREINTFKDVATFLREAEELRQAGEIQQITGLYYSPHISPVGVCAVGAIAYVGGIPAGMMWSSDLYETTWPILRKEVVNPVDGEQEPLCYVISTLHDSDNWTWPQLADWLESLEEGEN